MPLRKDRVKKFKLKPVTRPESEEGRLLTRWKRSCSTTIPELCALYHIPNENNHRKIPEGVLPGMPDYCLPIARNGYHAFYFELKRLEGGIISDSQSEVGDILQQYGNRVEFICGWEAARNRILQYLNGEIDNETPVA